jgi:prepilin-type N-terminal cleavage/methylation domain-containing protein
MILATGKPSSRRRCAFTLIELILVMTLLVVAVSMIAPKLSGFIRGRALDSEANRLLALAHAGQSRAVSEGMPMVLWFDQPNGTYGLEEETAPAGGDAQREMMEMAATVQLTVVNLAIDEDSPHTLQLVDSAGFSLWLVEMQNRTGYEIRDTGN